MKNRLSCCVKTQWTAVLALMLVLVSVSCRHNSGTSCRHMDDSRYAALDSTIAAIHDVDSLATLARQSHEQNDEMGEMIALKYQGSALRNLSRFDEAVEIHNRGLEIATRLCDTLEMALALNNLGTNYRRMGDLSKANGYHYEALALCDAFSDQEDLEAVKARVHSLNGIGNIEIEMRNYVTADSVIREALEGEKKLGRDVGMAINYGNLGTIKREIGETDSAWFYYRKSLEYNQIGGSKKGIALCHLHFGDLHEDERRFSHALEEYTLAYDQLKQEGDIWHWLDACLSLARVNVLLGEEEDAHRYLKEAEVEALRTGSKEYQAEVEKIHYDLSLLQGNSHEALQHYIRGTALMDSIYGLQKNDEIHTQRLNYERNRNTGQLDILHQDITRKKRVRDMELLFAMLLLLAATAAIAALVYAVRVRNRTHRLMSQVEETRSLFFTNVVHQLRTPLSAIMGAIDGIITESTANAAHNVYSATQAENCLTIERQGENLLMLVDRILDVGNVRSAITELDWRTGDAPTFMHMAVESYRERCVERHIELTYVSREGQVDIDTVPHYLSTIVGNLLENATNYCRDYGKITVTSQVDGGMFVIRVADDGMGISKEDLPHVFEPFYRSADAEALVDGVGIGLTVVRDMAMAMGGTVAVDSKKDSGSVFTVKLPSRHSHGVKERLNETLQPVLNVLKPSRRVKDVKEPTATGDANLPVVLIVEDHVDVARLVGRTLGKDFRVEYATDGEQGLAKALDLVPDVVITDVKMPLMDGITMCSLMRQASRVSRVPVIMLSARNADADRVRGINAGADAYLVKPFVAEELRAWVNRLIESHRVLEACANQPDEAMEPETASQPATAGQEGSPDEDKAFLDAFAAELDKQLVSGVKIDLDKLAIKFKMGESQLRRKLQSLTGKNVPGYVTQLRMEKAMRLLQSSPSEVLISDIAEQCGFLDVAYFSRVFKQYYGITPTQARK